MIIGGLAAGVKILLEKGPSRHHISEDQQFQENTQKFIFYRKTKRTSSPTSGPIDDDYADARRLLRLHLLGVIQEVDPEGPCEGATTLAPEPAAARASLRAATTASSLGTAPIRPVAVVGMGMSLTLRVFTLFFFRSCSSSTRRPIK
jgi:hypothetical protein